MERRSSWKPAKQWRKAANVIRTCHRLSGGIQPYVAIDIGNESDSDYSSGNGTSAFTALAADESFRGLVKDKREGSFRRLGGVAGIAAALASDAERGIFPGDVRRRQAAFGVNACPKTSSRPKSRFLSHLQDALSDAFLVVLLVCAAVSLGFGVRQHGFRDGWYVDGASIFLVVFVVATTSAVSRHGQAKQFDKLDMARGSNDMAATVVRAARRQEVSVSDIVVGDVVLLKAGEVVPADGVFLEGHDLQVDESSMNGEPQPVEIDAEKNPFLASGVKVVDGHGRMLVTAVGTNTAWGGMMSSIITTKEQVKNAEPTPLQQRLQGLTSAMGKIGIGVAVLVFTVLAARQHAGTARDSQGKPLFVVAIPEGIPLAVTLALAFTVKRVAKEHALVRRLSACETMGSVTAICTDMTGTLTLNHMVVSEFWVGNDQPKAATALAGSVLSLLRQGAGLNTTGHVYNKPEDNVSSRPQISGSPTEKALLSWAVDYLGTDTDALKKSCEVVRIEAGENRIGVMIRDNAGAVIAHWKGAARMVLPGCSMYVDTRGAAHELGIEQRAKLEKAIDDMAVAGLQCVALAYKQVNRHGKQPTMDDDKGLTLLALVGLKDPCRSDAKSAIDTCAEAGVEVKMVTNANIALARAVAVECGLISDNSPSGITIEGPEFRAMPQEQQLAIVDDIRVMARSLPMDKLLLVQWLKQKGHVVAVTGCGSKDAPALMEADIGLSMGIRGTEIAKESSDIVILNDSFSTVATAVRWGRCVHDNIQKFIQFHVTVNVAALVINYLSAITTGKMPLTTVQLLWINVIMDTMGVLALATGTPTEALMRRPPTGRAAPLISNAMWRNLIAQAAFQVFNLFNAREIEKKKVFAALFNSRMFLTIIAATVVLQAVMVEVLTRFAGTKRLGLGQWGVCFAIAAMSWPIDWAIKFIPVPDWPVIKMKASR
ncbi:calcium-transporting ATPase 7, plasma membrane-type isoform X2 [Brachypodium distachyon]|uniref:Calcium-transporting ATPase n=1 Tax=Brachypodium distachyon TaxID=15368 RepID=A0A0Q3L633_BRADI|nr:calcium-transporting ATPase 7, plasma membrane-type isoform X2 [Brachypodium distachyon]KQJ88101.1 hypothetical protein BRADI_4g15370v3 [Brachypodium distachyon]|eukprot:XP_014758045.2 calcium-transporting ATPase 7, plasma membrane-type isoform X2 [Brachypodium distachyon]